MESENPKSPWRTLLAQLLKKDPDLVQRLAERLMVRDVTIRRWADGENTPHQLFRTLELLAQELPEQDRENFVQTVQQQYPDWQLSPVLADDSPIKPLPSVYYSKLIQTSVQANDVLAFWSILSLLSAQLTSHLDPDYTAGLTLSICLCLPPSSNEAQVMALYLPLNQPNDHPLHLEHPFPVVLGMESSLGWVLTSREPLVFSPEELVMQRAESVVGQSVQRRGKVGGCLIVTSQKRGFFTKARLVAVEEFGRLATLALEEKSFYPQERLALGLFPTIEQQQERERKYSFRERMRDARRKQVHCSQQELERMVLHDLAQELLNQQ